MPRVSDYPESPLPTNCLPRVDDFAVQSLEAEDGGRHYNLDGAITRRSWVLEYNFLSTDDAAILDGHFEDAQGSDGHFYFTDPYTGTIYDNVRYEMDSGFEVKPHIKSFSPKRSVSLFRDGA